MQVAFDKIIDYEYERIDKFLINTCKLVCSMLGLIWILDMVNVFIVDKRVMTMVCLSSCFLMLLPVLLMRMKSLKRETMRYMVSVIYAVTVGILYTFLTFHVILLFVYPLVLMSIYGSRELNRHTILMVCVSMVISHITAVYWNVVPEEPFPEMYANIVYGLIPRLIELILFSKALNYITTRNAGMLGAICRYSQEMYETQEELVRAFAEISESKSGQTGQHVKRVAAYTDIFAQTLGIDAQERESLGIASMMHDIGKLMIPSSILDKPGKLTSEEYEIIKKHTEYGYQLLEHSPGRVMEIAKNIAYQHHERWDGKGYHKIEGEAIDYYSRIIAIVDVFDALASKRSYKEPWTLEDAYNEIVAQAGKQFDPTLVQTFQACFPSLRVIAEQLKDK